MASAKFGLLSVCLLGVTLLNTGCGGEGVSSLTEVPVIANGLTIEHVSKFEGNSGETNYRFMARIDNPVPEQITFRYQTVADTATAGNDYVAISGLQIILAGQSEVAIDVKVIGDREIEKDEIFYLEIKDITGVELEATQDVFRLTGAIRNDDATPVLEVADVSKVEGNEGVTAYLFTVSLNHQAPSDVNFSYLTTDGSASADADYTLESGFGTIATDQIETTIIVNVKGDLVPEDEEFFYLDISSVQGALLLGGGSSLRARGGIIDDDTTSILRVRAVSQQEFDTGETDYVFTASLDNSITSNVSFDYQTVDDTAQAGSDYVASSGSGSIVARTQDTTITIRVKGDTEVEDDESFYLMITNLEGATLAGGQTSLSVEGAIINDDSTPSLSVEAVSQLEADAGEIDYIFTVSLFNPTAGITNITNNVSFDYQTVDDTAEAGSDYVASSGSGSIAVGTEDTTITIRVKGDTKVEDDESFYLMITNIGGATLAGGETSLSVKGEILNNDFIPTLTVADVSATEGDAGDVEFRFIAQLSRAVLVGEDINFTYRTNHISTDDQDYTPITTAITISIPSQADRVDIVISIKGDTALEKNETFELVLESIVGAILVDSTSTIRAIGSIIDNDSAPSSSPLTLTIADVSKIEGDADTTEFLFTVLLNKIPSTTVSFAYFTNHVGTDNSDYSSVYSTAFISGNNYMLQISILVNGDKKPEEIETFELRLEAILGVPNLSSIVAIGTIADDDPDDDGDGLENDVDACGGTQNWLSDNATDNDGDGCRDSDQDDFPDDATRNSADSDGNGLIDIVNKAMLNNIRYNLAGTSYKVSDSDIGKSSGCSGDCNGYELKNNIALTGNWTPIGSTSAPFITNFDGGGYKISGVIISSSSLSELGFFVELGNSSSADPKGTVRNLTIVGPRLNNGNESGTAAAPIGVGAVAGRVNSGGLIDSVIVTNVVVNGSGGIDALGALVGISEGKIKNSSANGTIYGNAGDDYIGLIVGQSANLISDSSVDSGIITAGAGNDTVGGLVGYNSGLMIGTFASVNVNGDGDGDFVGGLAGKSTGTIQNSYATSSVAGGENNDYAGGLVGYNDNGKIRNSFTAVGNVSGGADNDNVGGLVGYQINQSVYNSYATVDVSGNHGTDRVGGLIGTVSGASVSYSYSLGNVSGNNGNDHMGGLIATTSLSTVLESYYSTAILLDNTTGDTLRGVSDEAKSDSALRSPTSASGIYASWHTDDWDFGTGTQYPALITYKEENSVRVAGDIICNQPGQGTDRVQCLNP